MKRQLQMVALLFIPVQCLAQTAFIGTWRPDPQKPGPNEQSTVVELIDGQYECKSCMPPYRVKADGQDHAVSGAANFDTMSVTIADKRTVLKIARKGGQTTAQIKDMVVKDGRKLIETQTIYGMAAHPFDMAREFVRIAPGPHRSHQVSGQWRLVQTDLVNHEEDTTYAFSGNTLTMSDHFGRSFSAKLDGTQAPYRGDPEFTAVSVKLLDSRTIEESDWNGGKVVKICTWTVRPDGNTMHVRFDDTNGHIQEQEGRRVR